MQKEGKREIKKWFLLAISYQPQSVFAGFFESND